MRTLLFDIDGTLLVTQNAGSEALSLAMKREFGVLSMPIEQIRFGGRTDRDLVHECLSVAEVEPSLANQGRLRRRYSGILRNQLPDAVGEVLPGVVDLLSQLSSIAQVDLAVMTGNFPETARMKLERFQLLDFFPWVIGGDLDAHRSDMARRAAAQIARRKSSSSDHQIIVIGDTPNDVRCAHAIGAECLAVCTGSATREELKAASADRIVQDLRDDIVLDYLAS